LHSNPGASRVIYLNFLGRGMHSDPYWNSGAAFETPRFSLDGDPSSWSSSEIDFIQQLWQTVAEDYAPFKIDVTTQDPGQDALVRSDSNDQNYGTQVNITTHTSWSPGCRCGGIAAVGVFDAIGFSAEKAWVFTDVTANNAVFAALAASHEAGHTLGLLHQGYKDSKGTAVDYAPGWAPWGPIMGAPYYQTVVQWSNTDYKSAYVNSIGKQDDIAVMQKHGAVIKTDDYGDTAATAFNLTNAGASADGMISTRADTDWFAVRTDGTSISFLATPAAFMPNLDISLTLYDIKGKLLAVSSPTTRYQGTAINPSGMSSGIQAKVTPGTYFIKVDGVGQGAMSVAGSYSDYGSLGAYNIQPVEPIVITDSSLMGGQTGSAYSQDLHSSGGSGSASWSVASGTLPDGLSLVNRSGQWSLAGNPQMAGMHTFALQATDANGMQSAPVSFNLQLTPALGPQFTTNTLPAATRTIKYSATINATPLSNLPLTWGVSGLPAGITYQVNAPKGTTPGSLLLAGTATVAGSYEITVTASNGVVSSKKFTLAVAALPAPVITSTPTNPIISKAYAFPMRADKAKAPLQWSVVAGSLPSGLNMSAAGVISGTTTDSASRSFTLRVVDANGEQTQKEFTITAASAIK